MLVVSATLSTVIGVFAPFLMPLIYKVISKINKAELTAESKRLIVTILATLVSIGMILVNFEWSGDIKVDGMKLLEFFLVNFIAIKGTVQTIYEIIIKGIPVIDRGLDKLVG